MATRSLPTPMDAEDADKQRQHRREKATTELISTETTYCHLLELLIKHYVLPLSDYKILTPEQHSALFPQLQIIKGLSDKFLAELNKRRKNWDPNKTKLSDLFEDFSPFFKMYQGYVNNHEKSVHLLRKLEPNQKWIEYMDSVRKDCQGFDLASLLILPIQRIPRYKLLLSEIVKNTKEDNMDYSDLKKALEKVENISMEINSRMKEFDRRETVKKIERKFNETVNLLAPHRQFLKEGKMWKVGRKRDRLYQFFLFNDILIYASAFGNKYSLHNQLSINAQFNVKKFAEEHELKYGSEKKGRLFQIISEQKSFVVYCDSSKECNDWFDVLTNSMNTQKK